MSNLVKPRDTLLARKSQTSVRGNSSLLQIPGSKEGNISVKICLILPRDLECEGKWWREKSVIRICMKCSGSCNAICHIDHSDTYVVFIYTWVSIIPDLFQDLYSVVDTDFTQTFIMFIAISCSTNILIFKNIHISSTIIVSTAV